MYEYGFPFDNAAIDNLDRKASSDEFAEYLEAITGMAHGVYPNPSTGLQVTAESGLSLNVGAGFCIIKGRIRRLVKDEKITLESSEALDRIDRVVMRLNKLERTISAAVLKGTAAVSPVPQELTRDGDIYEIALANVRVTKLSTSVNQSQITDLRANTVLCGYMPVFGSFDTTRLFDQYQAALDQFLELVDSALDETTAGYLQGQIDDNKAELQESIATVESGLTARIDTMQQSDGYDGSDNTISFEDSSGNINNLYNFLKDLDKDLRGRKITIKIHGKYAGNSVNDSINLRGFVNGRIEIIFDENSNWEKVGIIIANCYNSFIYIRGAGSSLLYTTLSSISIEGAHDVKLENIKLINAANTYIGAAVSSTGTLNSITLERISFDGTGTIKTGILSKYPCMVYINEWTISGSLDALCDGPVFLQIDETNETKWTNTFTQSSYTMGLGAGIVSGTMATSS